MPLTLDEVISRFPGWARAGRVERSELPGGITNRNYRIDVDGESFVVRIPGENTHLLGIERSHEHASAAAAFRVGVGPEVVRFFSDIGVLVTRFIEGKKIPAEEIRRPENLRRVAASVRRVHDGDAVPGRFSTFRTVDAYLRNAREARVTAFPKDLDAFLERMREMEAALSPRQEQPRPCHNDLLNDNFIDDGRTIRILDWEYAGMGDVFFDLANFAVHHGLADEDERTELEAYRGGYRPADHARLKLFKLASDMREAMWGMVQLGISKLEFDFLGYANRHFDRFRRNAADPRYDEWLRTV